MDLQKKYQEAYRKIREADNIILITHERPDGDALSSVCALSLLLEKLQKKYFIYCHDPAPALFNFIPNIEKVKSAKSFFWEDFDLAIVVDCGALSRTKLEEELRSKRGKKYIIEFDHHPAVDAYADLEIRLPGSSSAAEVLFHFFKENSIALDKKIATCLLAGILTDTANFLNASTSAETIAIASEMLSAGAQMPKINRFAWRNKNIDSMKVLGSILDNLKINPTHNLAFSCLTLPEMEAFSESEETFDSVMNFLSNIDGVKAVMLVREEAPGKIKGSLRSNYPGIDISRLAKYLGGGGHPKASGFKMDGRVVKTKGGWKII